MSQSESEEGGAFKFFAGLGNLIEKKIDEFDEKVEGLEDGEGGSEPDRERPKGKDTASEGDSEDGESGKDDDGDGGADPEPAGEADGDDDGGYAPSSGGEGGSYAQDVAMMRAEIDHIDSTVLPHYELLISQAEKAGNGPATVQALRAGLESARTARGEAASALEAVQATSEPVQQAYDDAGGEAATDKSYYEGD